MGKHATRASRSDIFPTPTRPIPMLPCYKLKSLFTHSTIKYLDTKRSCQTQKKHVRTDMCSWWWWWQWVEAPGAKNMKNFNIKKLIVVTECGVVEECDGMLHRPHYLRPHSHPRLRRAPLMWFKISIFFNHVFLPKFDFNRLFPSFCVVVRFVLHCTRLTLSVWLSACPAICLACFLWRSQSGLL